MSEWPELRVSDWNDTLATFHLWTQVIGKIRMALTPPLNHWWHVTLYVSSRGLTTSMMPATGCGLEIEFDFVDQVLDFRTTDGRRRQLTLAPHTVADFYAATMHTLDELGVHVTISASPNELVDAIPFARDTTHGTYDGDAVRRFWLQLVNTHRVMSQFRTGFIGKSSPIHFFWGAADLALTRFSGRRAPKHPGGVPNCPDYVQDIAYSHEVSSCGFWPGGAQEGAFYAYAYPTPDGYADRAAAPEDAYFDHDLGEFLLPYEVVRSARDPDAALLSFFESTYAIAADLARWNRAELEL